MVKSWRKEQESMKKSEHSAEQVAFALMQAESSTPVPEVCRKIGISEQAFYRWKKKYDGTGVAEVLEH
jgi:putative transposase